MTDFTIASFNVKNLIGPGQEYYRFQSYSPEEYAWKKDWMADQLLSLDADIVCFQEIFDQAALRDVIDETSRRARALNAATIPAPGQSHRRKAIFRKLKVTPYDEATLVFAPNAADTGEPGARRPGLALLSRPGVVGTPERVQDLDPPLDIAFPPVRGLAQDAAGHFTLRRVSRPIQKVRISLGGREITVFNCHLKSKLGEYMVPPDGAYAPEADLTAYDALGRGLGSLRAAVRRMAEAWVLRRAVVAELSDDRPVLVLGDFNDGEDAVSSEIIAGETPFKNYAWMLRHDATDGGDRYSAEENAAITEEIERLRLHSAEKIFVRKSLRDMVYTASFGGVYDSIDQIFLSRHFLPGTPGSIGEMTYFSVLNDHLTDGAHPEAPYNKLASDHGQIMAHIRMS
ncbi:MAG: endonuclease/exonuclease/phosphatase family protein [Pseudomonadota bacterium]